MNLIYDTQSIGSSLFLLNKKKTAKMRLHNETRKLFSFKELLDFNCQIYCKGFWEGPSFLTMPLPLQLSFVILKGGLPKSHLYLQNIAVTGIGNNAFCSSWIYSTVYFRIRYIPQLLLPLPDMVACQFLSLADISQDSKWSKDQSWRVNFGQSRLAIFFSF